MPSTQNRPGGRQEGAELGFKGPEDDRMTVSAGRMEPDKGFTSRPVTPGAPGSRTRKQPCPEHGERLNRQNEQAAQGDKTPKLTGLRKGAENQTPLYLRRMRKVGELAGAQPGRLWGHRSPLLGRCGRVSHRG